MNRNIHKYCSVFLMMSLAIALLFVGGGPRPYAGPASSGTSTADSYIVQASSTDTAKRSVLEVGGTVTATLGIINAVGVRLSAEQLASLRSRPEPMTIYADDTLTISGPVVDTHFPTLIGAADLHGQGITGDDVTIAVLDTGLWKTSDTQYSTEQEERILAQYDVLESYNVYSGNDNDGEEGDDEDDRSYDTDIDDWNGHGTHVTSIMLSSGQTAAGRYQGVAPDANVVAVRAFRPDGSGRYLDVIRAIDWIVSHRSRFGIRILNLSFSARPNSFYWEDPVNQAVMAAWRSGIVVVVAAGNSGPDPLSIGVPGNVPYVITVGAMTDNYTPGDTGDDRLATFSAAGPTFEGFVKPDLIAPGGHMLGRMPSHGWLALEHPELAHTDGEYFSMSGTSQAAAVVSGVLALMLQADPELNPDQAKCRLMASARPAALEDGSFAYSVFQQGAGNVDARAAIQESATDCANRGINVTHDLSGWAHYQGPARVDQSGDFRILDANGNELSRDGLTWNQSEMWNQGLLWPQGMLWNQRSLWSRGALWNQGTLWNQGVLWPQTPASYQNLRRAVSINSWVAPE